MTINHPVKLLQTCDYPVEQAGLYYLWAIHLAGTLDSARIFGFFVLFFCFRFSIDNVDNVSVR